MIKKARITLLITILSMTASSISLMFITLVSSDKGMNSWMAYIIALIFWLGIVLAFVSTIITKIFLSKERQKLIDKEMIKKQVIPGIVYFDFKMNNIIIYSIMGIGLLLIVSDLFMNYIPEAIMFPVISITLISFSLHCVIDGKYYKVYKTIKESVKK